jgi:hypothetical protein
MQVGTVEPVAMVLHACMQEFPKDDTSASLLPTVQLTAQPLTMQQLASLMQQDASYYAFCSETLMRSNNIAQPAIEAATFFACMRHGLVSFLKPIFDLGTWDPAFSYQRPIWVASKLGCIEGVALLLADERVDPSASTNQAIMAASENGHAEIVQLLLKDPRVDPSAFDTSALTRASVNGRAEVVDILLGDPRVQVSLEIIRLVNCHPYARPEVSAYVKVMRSLVRSKNPPVWPSILCHDVTGLGEGLLRLELNAIEAESTFFLLLCVKRMFPPCVAARVGDVLRDVCVEWTSYSTL